jgi:hypothetical protein
LSNSIAKDTNDLLRYKLNLISAEAYRDDEPVLRRLLDKLSHNVQYDKHKDIRGTIDALREEGYVFHIEYREPIISLTQNKDELIVHAKIRAPKLSITKTLYEA